MIGPYDRPEMRIAFINDDGTIDTTGWSAFERFETVPQVGDIIVSPRLLDDAPEAVQVVENVPRGPWRRAPVVKRYV